MVELEYVPFKPWHLKLFEGGRHYKSPITDPDFRAAIFRHVNGVTLLINGEIAAILGVVQVWGGVAEVTMVPSDLLYANLRPCLRAIKSLLQLSAETYHLHRIQATTLTAEPKHGRFLESLGFKYEGCLRKWSPAGEDFNSYSLILEE